MPIASRETTRQDFSFESVDAPGDVEVRDVQRGRASARSFRLVDDPDALEVRVAGRAATLLGPVVGAWTDEEPARVELSLAALADLARLLSAWIRVRETWAAYVGPGLYAKFWGYTALYWFRPGAREPEEIGRDDPRLEELRAAPRVRLAKSELTICERPVEHELRSHTGELVGAVVRGGGRLVVLARGGALVGAPSDRGATIKLGQHLATAGRGYMPPDVARLPGVIVRPDTVDVIVQAARARASGRPAR